MEIYQKDGHCSYVPFGRLEAYELGHTTYAELDPCPHCEGDVPAVTTRYVETHTCVRCCQQDTTRWLRTEPTIALRTYPDDVPVICGDNVGAPDLCSAGPHFRKDDGDGHCVRCLTVLGRVTASRQARANLVVSRQEARAKSLPLYMDAPCHKGHEGWRRVETGRCWECSLSSNEVTPVEQCEAGTMLERPAALKLKLPLYFGSSCQHHHAGWRYVRSGRCFDCHHEVAVIGQPVSSSEQVARDIRVSKIQAKAEKLKLYYSKPCRYGHEGWRWVKTGGCYQCTREPSDRRGGRVTPRQQVDRDERVTLEEAKERKLPLYNGTSCKRGHDTWRRVGKGDCYECSRLGMKQTPAQQYQDGAGEPVDRKTAFKLRLPLFLGTPCKKGHDGWRRTDSGACYGCLAGHGRRAPQDMPRDVATLLGYDEFWVDGSWQR